MELRLTLSGIVIVSVQSEFLILVIRCTFTCCSIFNEVPETDTAGLNFSAPV